MKTLNKGGRILDVWCVVAVTLQLFGYVTSNMYVNTNSAHNGVTWGKYCYGNGGYIPTCGFELILSSSYTLSQLEVWHSVNTRIDAYTHKLVPTHTYRDTSSRQSECSSITIHGSFGSNEPEISITYSCVCTAANGATCVQVPYTLVSPWDAPDPTTAVTTSEGTTEPTTIETTAEATSEAIPIITPDQAQINSNNVFLTQYSNNNISSIKLVQIKNSCYTGTSVQTMTSPIDHLPDCGSICLLDDTCGGVNYYTAGSQCVIVKAEVDEKDPDRIARVTGCQLWKVLWKK